MEPDLSNESIEAECSSDPDRSPAPFWSPWATAGWGIVVSIAFVVIQTAAVIVWAVKTTFSGAETDIESLAGRIATNGDVLAIGTLATGVLCSALVFLLVKIQRGSRPRETLALQPPRPATIAGWLALTIGLIAVSDGLTAALGRPIVPQFIIEAYQTATFPALLACGVIIGSPFFEELFFRGFLLEGLRRGRLGNAGAIVTCSFFWAAIHIQYGVYEITAIFLFGLVLGLARIRTGSLWVPIAMHSLTNLVATVETAMVIRSTEVLPI